MASNDAPSTNSTSASARSSRRRRAAPNASTGGGGGGAAESEVADEEPTTATSSTTSTTGGYNVREYQNPDAGAKDLALTKAAKGKGKKEKGGDTHVCFHCGKSGAKLRSCAQCRRAWYCGRDCQVADWKRHKQACRAAVAAEARRATRAREATAAARAAGGRAANEECVVCMGPVVAPVELPCGHAYCGACLAELRAKGVAQACPLCRAELPPGVEGLYELAMRSVMRIEGMVTRGEMAWASLPTAEQEEIDEAVAMLREAGAQGHAGANYLYGCLLRDVRKDIDGAEAAWRAAIAANPGHADAHCALGVLLEVRAQRIVKSGGDLAAAAALYDECAQLWSFSQGDDHEWTTGARADAARIRAALASSVGSGGAKKGKEKGKKGRGRK